MRLHSIFLLCLAIPTQGPVYAQSAGVEQGEPVVSTGGSGTTPSQGKVSPPWHLFDEKLLPQTVSLVIESDVYGAGQTAVAKKYYPLGKVRVTAAGAVILNRDVPADIQKAVSASSDAPLNSGQKLFAVGGADWLYCTELRYAPHWRRVITLTASCLVDADRDGLFEQAVKVGGGGYEPRWGAVTRKGRIVEVSQHGQPVPLRERISYQSPTLDDLPVSEAEIVWATNYNPKKPGPYYVQFAFRTDAGLEGRSLLALMRPQIYEGKPISVNFAGATISVSGISEDGALSYQISGGGRKQKAPFYIQVPVVEVSVPLP